MPSTLILTTWTILASSPRLFVSILSNSEKTGFYPLPSIYLIVQFQYICIAVSESLTRTSEGNNFLNQSPVFMCSSFCL